MNIKTEYELTKQRGKELHPEEDFDMQLYVAWKHQRKEHHFWRDSSIAMACAVVMLILGRS